MTLLRLMAAGVYLQFCLRELKMSEFIDTELPLVIPIFPLAGALLLPGGQLPLNIFEPRYIQMVKDTLATNHRLIVMTLPLPEKSNGSEIYKLACAGKLIS